jgi:archaeosine-15-forming tRNA-guanine transglycosylase
VAIMSDLDDLSDNVLVAGVRLAEQAPYYFWRYIVSPQKAPFLMKGQSLTARFLLHKECQ